jgi:hypothetical protein
MDEIRITYRELIIYIPIVNAILGALFGALPLLVGLKLGNRKYAYLGFVTSIAGGIVLGILLSFPLAFLFTWLIVRGPSKSARMTDGPAAN